MTGQGNREEGGNPGLGLRTPSSADHVPICTEVVSLKRTAAPCEPKHSSKTSPTIRIAGQAIGVGSSFPIPSKSANLNHLPFSAKMRNGRGQRYLLRSSTVWVSLACRWPDARPVVLKLSGGGMDDVPLLSRYRPGTRSRLRGKKGQALVTDRVQQARYAIMSPPCAKYRPINREHCELLRCDLEIDEISHQSGGSRICLVATQSIDS